MTKTPTPAVMQGLIENAMQHGEEGDYAAGQWMLDTLHRWDLEIVPMPNVEKIRPSILGQAVFMSQHDGTPPMSEFQVNRATGHAQKLIEYLNAAGWTITRSKQ